MGDFDDSVWIKIMDNFADFRRAKIMGYFENFRQVKTISHLQALDKSRLLIILKYFKISSIGAVLQIKKCSRYEVSYVF